MSTTKTPVELTITVLNEQGVIYRKTDIVGQKMGGKTPVRVAQELAYDIAVPGSIKETQDGNNLVITGTCRPPYEVTPNCFFAVTVIERHKT